MSSGRKKRTAKVNAQGVNRESILSNLTQVDNGKETLSMSFFKGRKKAMNWSGALRDLEKQRDTEFLPTVSQISDDQLENLNMNFSKRSSELLRRNAFQGRDQLLLTDRLEL